VHSPYVSLHVSVLKKNHRRPLCSACLHNSLVYITVDTRATVAYPECHCQHNRHPLHNMQVSTLWLFFFIRVIFQAHLDLHCLELSCQRDQVIAYEYLTWRPHAARGYRVKLQRQKYTKRRTTYDTYINKLGECRTLWGEREWAMQCGIELLCS